MDIIYVPMAKDFLYLTAVLDWQLSNSFDVGLCLHVLADALRHVPAPPRIFLIPTRAAVHQPLLRIGPADRRLSHQPRYRGRAIDNAFIERLWRTVKWEHIYLNPVDDGRHLHQ